jgi:hypothetical protein
MRHWTAGSGKPTPRKERLGFLVPYLRRRDAEGYAKVDRNPETARKE